MQSPGVQDPVYRYWGWFWCCWFVAQLSFLTTLHLPYQGEEAVYTLTSMEMAFHGDWISPTLYGANYGRPPLYNWLMIPLAQTLGWDQVLVAARCITALATLGTSLVLIALVQRLSKDRTLALLSALAYMSADVLFRRGWLAYSDPLFAFFSFSALAAAWIALEEQRLVWMIPAMFCLIASFLTKAFTGYIFYALGMFVLLLRHPNRAFLWRWPMIAAHATALLFLVCWHFQLSQGTHATGMVRDIANKWAWPGLGSYLLGLLSYPLETWFRWLPLSAVLFLPSLIAHVQQSSDAHHLPGSPEIVQTAQHSQQKSYTAAWQVLCKNPWFSSLILILILNYLPYWLSPHKHIRYLMPLYPLIAWALAYILQTTLMQPKMQMATNIRSMRPSIKIMMGIFAVIVILRYGLGLFWFPYYQKHYRGDYQAIAQDVLKIAENKPVYSNDTQSIGLSVSACVDSLIMPQHIVQYPPSDLSTLDGVLISTIAAQPPLQLRQTYLLGSKKLYLFCGGAACGD